jgi:uncharacterized protein YqjF (DUF2071 family)
MSAPTRRSAFLTAEWRYLVMLNFEIAPIRLAPLVPAGTVLDLFEGHALVSVVGFRFLDTRLRGVPVPWHRNFDEVNLRFYVRREMAGGEVRRGVVFVRELVPRAAIALIARAVYNEPYRAVAMRSSAPALATEAPGHVEYAWRTSEHWQHVGATATGAPAHAIAGSEEEFVTGHFWGYTRQRDGGTVEYEVEHARWRVWAAREPELDADVLRVYGSAFSEALCARPRSAFVAEGSPVRVYPPKRLTLVPDNSK